eukprot:Pgem_evm1s8107
MALNYKAQYTLDDAVNLIIKVIKAAEVLKCNPENERVNGSFLYVTKFKIKPENTNKRIDVQGTICKKMNKETFDNSKAEKELNYKPQYTLDDAVNRVIKDWEIMNS